jgi:cephalosporin hydroxylase
MSNPTKPAVSWWIPALLAAVAGFTAGGAITSLWLSRPDEVTAAFHRLYHARGDRTYNNTYWLGVPVQKCPLDLWVFQEILFETRPDVLVETGTYKGGSAYFFASMFDLMGRGRVITIDIQDQPDKPRHPRIEYLLGSSTSPETVRQVRERIRPGERVMVVLDSDHKMAHVLEELRLYSGLVTPGNYLVVEDTHFNGHPILPRYGPGPMEAVEEFLRTAGGFEADREREKFGLTFNPRGYLRRSSRLPAGSASYPLHGGSILRKESGLYYPETESDAVGSERAENRTGAMR